MVEWVYGYVGDCVRRGGEGDGRGKGEVGEGEVVWIGCGNVM